MSTSTDETRFDDENDESDDASSSFADFHELDNDIETADPTMNFASGSVFFSISGVLFKIPKALLQQHSLLLSAMLDINSEEQVIVLSDSINAFRQFRKVLFTPLESCLFSDTGDSGHISDLLDLLAISHKYCASTIEARTLEKLTVLTGADKVGYLDADICVRILEIAFLVDSNELARPARASLLWSMQSHTSEGPAGPADCNLVKVLAFGKDANDREIAGAAYYAIMCNGREWWSSDDNGVDQADRCRLTEGMMRCAVEWHDIQTRWAADGFGCHSECVQKRNVLNASLRNQALRGTAWYDVVGKIKATLSANSDITSNRNCEFRIADTVSDALHRVRSEFYEYFTERI